MSAVNAGMAALEQLHATIAAGEHRRATQRRTELQAELDRLEHRAAACRAELARLEATGHA